MALRKTQEGGADIRLRVDPVPSTQKMTKKKRGIAKMKQMKKLASLLLALVMTLALSVSALAAGETGSITIQNPITGETYKAYLMFELESYNTTDKAYSYKITKDWREFVETGFGKDYFTIDTQGYVTMKEGVNVADNSAEAAALAKAALAYAAEKKLTPAATLPANGSYTATGLTLGYYLIDSSLGALCGLTTTQPSATIAEKNQEPCRFVKHIGQ